ncbi:MAG: hypothetical protein HKN57_08465 [Xanthomonadales bacterium]|nr:hypothetical protein [Xanthomonadales bacterium]
MGKWIRKNLVLISGIVLPVLLVGGFFALSQAPKMLADPPQYDFVLVGYRYDYQRPGEYYLSFEVRDGQLTGRAIPRDDSNTNFNRQYAAVFRYSAAANTFEEIVFDLPEGLDSIDQPLSLPLPETAGLRLDKRRKSPDGYTYEFLGYRGRGGLLGEMFGMRHRYESGYVLKKDSAYFDLPTPVSDPYYQNDLHFMGWVVDEDRGKDETP